MVKLNMKEPSKEELKLRSRERQRRKKLGWVLFGLFVLISIVFKFTYAHSNTTISYFLLILASSVLGLSIHLFRYKNWPTFEEKWYKECSEENIKKKTDRMKDELNRQFFWESLLKGVVWAIISVAVLSILIGEYNTLELELVFITCAVNILVGFSGGTFIHSLISAAGKIKL